MESIVREDKIHFYEYMESEILHSYIKTGIEYALNSVFSSYDQLIPYRYYVPDLATLIKALKDFYFLLRHKGLYAENFYGLERNKQITKLSALIDVFLWVILPHLLKKIQNLFLKWKEEVQGSENRQRIHVVKRLFVKIYPFMFAAMNILQTVMKFRYLISPQSKYYSLEYYLTKTQTEYIKSQEEQWKYPIAELLKSPGLFLLLASHKVIGYFFSNSSRNTKRSEGQALKISEPIKWDKNMKRSKECPICGKAPRDKAFLKSSGYIFCYKCIAEYISSNKECPVTKIQSTEDSIQLLYD